MRLPPSVVSLIESHLLPADLRATKTAFKVLGPSPSQALQPQTRPQGRYLPQSTASNPAPGQNQRLSLHRILQKYPHKPQISLGVAHRLLNDHADSPSPSSLTLQLLSRQTIYERILRTFASSPNTSYAKVTIPSIYQRMLEEGVPPNTNILKIVLGTALRNDLPILPLLRQVVEGSGLPESIDTHLLLLVGKGLVREVGIAPKELGVLVDECLTAAGLGEGERPVAFDELMVEAYGRAGSLKGMLSILDKSKERRRTTTTVLTTHSPKDLGSILSLYLQAMSQWSSNPLLRRKRHGSLLPRALARDLIAVYGTPRDLPLPFLNAWMNAERIAGNLKAGLAVWDLISSRGRDTLSYSTYFRLLKYTSPGPDSTTSLVGSDLRNGVKDLLAARIPLTTEVIEHALSAAFRYRDAPLALLLARKIDPSPTRHQRGKVPPSARIIDVLASSLIRVWRTGGLITTFDTDNDIAISTGPKGEQIRRSEWEMITLAMRDEATAGVDLGVTSLPLSTPQASLVDARLLNGDDETGVEVIRRYQPAQAGKVRASLVAPLIRLLEKAVVELELGSGSGRESGRGHEDELKEIMRRVNDEVLP